MNAFRETLRFARAKMILLTGVIVVSLLGSASLARADSVKEALFVFGIHTAGIEGVASEFRGKPTSEHPGAMALIKRNLKWSIDLADAMKFGSDELKAIQTDVDRLTFADMEDRMAKLRLSYQATFAKTINPAAAGPFILGIHQNGAERIALEASGFARAKRPGSGMLIERNLGWMKDETKSVGVSEDLLLKIQSDFLAGAAFDTTATELAKLRLKWQAELKDAPPYGTAPALTAVTIATSGGGFNFGIAVAGGKLLTFSPTGSTNSTVVRIDGKTAVLGSPVGKSVEKDVKLPDGGFRSAWIFNNVRFTQLLEPVRSQSGRRDTVQIRWLIRNEDNQSHQVGLRLQLDTLIGHNDGVPFTVPGMSGLVTTTADFPKQAPIPHFIQALEVANLQNPGTVAHLTLKLGGRTEAPGRVCLTHWPGFSAFNWEVPMNNLTGDSAVVLYWPDAALQSNQEREIGFSYGLGDVQSSEGRIATTTVTQAQSGHEFPITAYVKDPAPGETLTLEPPAGLQVVGAATVPVPPPPPDSRTSLVTWKARAAQAGNFEFAIRSSTGVVQRQQITVTKGEGVVQPDDATPLQKLIQQLQDPDESNRLRAAKELGKLGAAAKTAIPALQNALKDTDEDVRRVAANSLKLIQVAQGTGSSEQVQRLIQALQNPDESVRLKAAKDLGKLGPAAAEAVPDLQKALQDPDEDVRRVAANSIRLIQAGAGPSEALRKLMQNLASPDELVRLKAAKDLAKMGPAAREAVPALQKLLQDPDEDVRRVAANAIERIQGGNEPPPTVIPSVAGTVWNGSETLSGFGKLTFQFEPDGKAVMIDAVSRVNGKWSQTGDQVVITFANCVYTGTIKGEVLAGPARFTTNDTNWTFSVTRGAAAPQPAPENARPMVSLTNKPWREYKLPPAVIAPPRR